MPTVPIYSPQAEPNALPSAAFSGDGVQNFAARQAQEMGGAMVRAGGALSLAGAVVKDQQEKSELTQAYNQWADGRRVLLDDGDKGYLATTHGEAAVKARGNVVRDLGNLRRQIGVNLSPVLQQRFQDMTQRDYEASLDHVDKHYAHQTKVYLHGQTVAKLQGFLADGMANATDWRNQNGAYAKAVNDALETTHDLAQQQGMSVEQELQEMYKTAAHMGALVVNNLVSLHKNQDAKEYLSANAEAIEKGNPEGFLHLQKLVEEGVGDDMALALSRQISTQTKGNVNASLKILGQQFDTGKINAKTYEKASSFLKQDYAFRKSQEADYHNNLLEQVYQSASDPSHPATALTELAPQLRLSLQSAGLSERANNIINNTESPQAAQKFMDLMVQAASDPVSFVTANNPDDWKGYFNRQHYGQLVSTYLAAKKNDVKGQEALRVTMEAIQRAGKEITAAGLDPKRDKEGYAEWQQQMYATIQAAITAKGGGVSSDEALRIIHSELQRIPVRRRFWLDGSKSAYKNYSDDIPQELREKIDAAVLMSGQPLTEENRRKVLREMSAGDAESAIVQRIPK